MSAVSLSPDVSKLAATYELGEPYAEFQTSPEKHSKLHFTVSSCITYLIIGVLALFITTAALVSLFDGSSASASEALICLSGILIFALWLSVSGDSKTIIRNWTIYVCPQGLLQYNARTSEAHAILWEQIAEYYIHIWGEAESRPESEVFHSWKCYLFTLKCSDGTSFKFKGTSDFGTLQHIIEKEVVSLQLPPILEAYNEGQTITFGAITLNQIGVSNGQYTFPWDKILCIDFEGNFIHVRGFQWDTSFSVAKSSVPNACVLEALVRRLDGQGKSGIASPEHMTTSEKRFSRKAHRIKHHRNS